MKRTTLLLIALLLCCISMIAQQRSESEAIQIAQEFFGKKGKMPQLSVVSPQKITAQIRKKVAAARKAPAKNSGSYVVNDEANNRFVIVSADERLNTILGYSEKGAFDLNNVPDGLLFLIDGYNIQYDSLLAGKVEYIQSPSRRSDIVQAVSPLLSTEWGQGFPFNELCPEDPFYGGKCVTGCIATAMAQVMKYYNWPERGKGDLTYNSEPYGLNLSLDFSSYQFDWDSMPNKYNGDWTDTQRDAVARLNYACGVSVAMQYTNSSSGSGAYPANIAYALINNFGYNPNIMYYDHDYYYKEEWDSLIQVSLSKKRPVLYGGDGGDLNGGHQFVIDGVNSDGLYHINWGWYGNYNEGYYELTALKPGKYDFSLGHSMVCGITPEQEKLEPTADFCTIGFIPNEWLSPVSVGTYTSCTFGKTQLCGTSYHTLKHQFNGYIGIGVFDENFNFIKSLTRSRINTDGAHYYSKLSMSYKYDSRTFSEGSQYYIAPYSIENGAETPNLMHTKGGVTDWYLATVEKGIVKLTKRGIIEPDDLLEGLVGTFNVKALDKSGNMKYWQTTVTKAWDENGKYYFQNFDPAAGEITVTAYMQKSGNYEISLDKQNLPDNISLFSASSSISVTIDRTNNTMSIDDIWGTKQRSVSGDIASDSELSYYKSADYRYPPKPVLVEKPVIVVDDNHVLNITCATEGADIYYTKSEKGLEPTELSPVFVKAETLTENTVIVAKAYKEGSWSESNICSYTGITAAAPVFTSKEHTVFINCPNQKDAVIYYTTDGTQPTVNEEGKYSAEGIPCTKTTTFKAIATYPNWNDSPIATYIHVIEPEPEIVIHNEAGQLPSKISGTEKQNAVSLQISGQLNGTDIKFIREMLSEGKLAYLDMEQASIVEGGESYNPDQFVSDMTEDNVIGRNMFNRCKNLVSLKLPNSATKIDVVAVTGCEKLKELSLPASCETVIQGAIQSCKNLETIYLPKNVKYFIGSIFDGCQNLTEIIVDDDNPYFTSLEGVMFTKDMSKLIKYPAGIKQRSYTIPTNVQTIGEHAFSYSALEELELPSSLTSIENFAFVGCKQLNVIAIPSSVTNLGPGAFQLCQNLSFVSLSPNIEKLNDYTFDNCISLADITIGSGTKEVNGSAFDNCSSLRAIYVDDDNEYYSSVDGILYSKDMKKLVRCPAGLYKEEYLIPDGVEIITEYALTGCKNIKKFTLPQTLREIERFAFIKSAMSSIVIPSSVNKIGASAFQLCQELETLVFPDGITEIAMGVASNCEKLSYVYIPSSVTSIGSDAFSWCVSLSTIKTMIKNVTNLEVGLYAFYRIPDKCTWRVPAGTSGRYKAQPWWVSTWSIIDPCDLSGDGTINALDIQTIINACVDESTDAKFDVNVDGKVNALDIQEVINGAAATE